ncbi:hypothetical protein N7541_002515 [Penicillium brevicompactum]|uniref:Uncharacterized protein n=1 Tax=Penicillium brevicompactum TaxID=5074 RepID=A0A9W9RKG5_PENBR|nr:uncharacterized protein N7506_006490 [Penicillium brevicompactum]KAJ5332707.1 hypothetical protein N7506_006490 [Penicillium brevicompactum]KAJ5361671.1 hypothetical protein N7541_002515 [Penicillium brevicompactum]
MKFTVPILASLVATSTALFDKNQPWGKRDYSCVNVYQGIPDGSTVTAGQTIKVRFDRKPTAHCADPLNKYPGDDYSVWLYNNPVRKQDTISFDQSIKITSGIKEKAGVIDVTIPKNLPQVKEGSLWYLRVQTSLSTAPQMPSLFNAQGPFTVAKA